MLLNNVNLNSFLVLEQVVKHKSMTKAASFLNMTQPGVSQHITHLEGSLGLDLFTREGKQLMPSKDCLEIYRILSQSFNKLEDTLVELGEHNHHIRGKLVIGAPIEFGNNILFPKLAQYSKLYPNVKFHIRFGLAYEMSELLRIGKIDFAFTDGDINFREVFSQKVYQEQLLLCCTHKYLEDKKLLVPKTKAEFKNLDYMSYFEDASILKRWFKQGLGLQIKDLNIIARTEDAQGVLAFINNSMGLGVVPKHMTLKSKNLCIINPIKKPVLNDIAFSYYVKRARGSLMNSFIEYINSSFNLSSSS